MGDDGWRTALWTFVNSPIFLTLVSVGLGSLVVAWLSARWQRQALKFEFQLRLFDQLNSLLIDYMKAVFGEEKTKKELGHRLLIAIQASRALFGERTWQAISDFRAAAKDEKREGESIVDWFDRVKLVQKYHGLMNAIANDMGPSFAKVKKKGNVG